MKKRPLQVALELREPSVIEITVGDRVQLDRLTPSTRGLVPERHGALLEPGKTMKTLAEGHYRFRTLCDASLHVAGGGVDVHAVAHGKDTGWPDPGMLMGDEPEGEPPALTIE